jgi:hypothetical protein
VEYYDKKTAATAKGGITRNMTACQKVLDYLDEWKETNLARAMLSNRKNHTSLELTLAADERKSKEYARLAAELKAKKKLTNPTSQLKKSATVEKHDSSLINKSEKKGDSSEDESDSAEYNDANSGDEDVKIDWTKKFHTKQRKTTAWDVIASGEYRVLNYFDANAPKKDKKILDSVLVFDGKDITMYKAWKESVSMAICANMSLPFDEKLFKLRSKLKGVPHGYVESYQVSGINFSRALSLKN